MYAQQGTGTGTRTNVDIHIRRNRAKHCTGRYIFVCVGILGSCYSYFLSACRSILVVVRAQQLISNVFISPQPKPVSYKLLTLTPVRSTSFEAEKSIPLPHNAHTPAYSLQSKEQLEHAVKVCLKLSPEGDCSNGPHGPMEEWDVSRVNNMLELFSNSISFDGDISTWGVSRVSDMAAMFMGAKSFKGDISKWDVSSVRNMYGMFSLATSFNGDISKWDVSRVAHMDSMFRKAISFERKLCGAAWVHSRASKSLMFEGSSGSISATVSFLCYTRVRGVLVVVVVTCDALVLVVYLLWCDCVGCVSGGTILCMTCNCGATVFAV